MKQGDTRETFRREATYREFFSGRHRAAGTPLLLRASIRVCVVGSGGSVLLQAWSWQAAAG